LFGKTLLKAENDYVFQNCAGGHGPFGPPGYTYGSTTYGVHMTWSL